MLGVKLWRSAYKEVAFKITKTVFWIDAASVLDMINNVDTRFKVFVANRLSYIHAYTSPALWRYVPTLLNSADTGTHVLLPSQLDKLRVWIDGPDFLEKPECDWPVKTPPEVDKEEIVSSLACVTSCKITVEQVGSLAKMMLYYSSLRRLQDGLVYFWRFALYLKNRKSPGFCPPSGLVTPEERVWSLEVLC